MEYSQSISISDLRMFLGLSWLFRYFIKDYTDKRISIKEESEKEMFNKTEEMN